MRSRLWWLCALALTACSSSVGQGTGGQGTGGTNTGGQGTGGQGTGGGACDEQHCSCWSPTCPCAACDQPCDPSNPCPEKYRCDYPDNMCGKGAQGACKMLPLDCALGPPMPRACSCNGGVGAVDCIELSGSDISADPLLCSDGTFTCGSLACKRYVEYCETVQPGAGGEPTYACKATTCTYGIAACACIQGLPPGACQEDADGQIRVTIALP